MDGVTRGLLGNNMPTSVPTCHIGDLREYMRGVGSWNAQEVISNVTKIVKKTLLGRSYHRHKLERLSPDRVLSS